MADRVLKDGINECDKVNELTIPAEVFYRRLLSITNDQGITDSRIPILRSKLYPLKLDEVTEAEIKEWLDECIKAELIHVHSKDDRQYLEVIEWTNHIVTTK